MKLTDYCIVFGVILIGLFFTNDLRIRFMQDTLMTQVQLNNNIDGAVMDGLNAGFIGVSADSSKTVNLDNVSNYIFEEMSVMLYGRTGMGDMLENYVKVMLYMERDGYYMYDSGSWSDKILYANKEHELMVEEILTVIREKTGSEALVPYNYGENYRNTFSENSLILVYSANNKSFMSVAMLKKQNRAGSILLD